MKLSEAIRAGAKLRPQCIGLFFKEGCSCAAGAALEATGTPYLEYNKRSKLVAQSYHEFYATFLSRFPGISIGEIICKNDSAGLSRESIADWVETIEQQQEKSPTV